MRKTSDMLPDDERNDAELNAQLPAAISDSPLLGKTQADLVPPPDKMPVDLSPLRGETPGDPPLAPPQENLQATPFDQSVVEAPEQAGAEIPEQSATEIIDRAIIKAPDRSVADMSDRSVADPPEQTIVIPTRARHVEMPLIIKGSMQPAPWNPLRIPR